MNVYFQMSHISGSLKFVSEIDSRCLVEFVLLPPEVCYRQIPAIAV